MLAFRSASRSIAAPIYQRGRGLRAFGDLKPTKKKTIKQLASEISLKGQPVLVRADLNLPRNKEDGSIVDDTRARAVSEVELVQHALHTAVGNIVFLKHTSRSGGRVRTKTQICSTGVPIYLALIEPPPSSWHELS